MYSGLLGEYELTVDAKGRFMLPSAFRKQLEGTEDQQFVINRGFESCLSLYPMASWNALSAKLAKLNDFNPQVREFRRLFLNGATIVESDSAGRLLLPKTLMDYAAISKTMIFSAQGSKVELWDKDAYHEYIRKSAPGFGELASLVVGGDFLNPFDPS